MGVVHKPVIPVLRQRQEDRWKFKASQVNTRSWGPTELHCSIFVSQSKNKKSQQSYLKYSKTVETIDTYIDQPEVVFIDRKLLWTNVFFQSRGIGALQENIRKVLWDENRRGDKGVCTGPLPTSASLVDNIWGICNAKTQPGDLLAMHAITVLLTQPICCPSPALCGFRRLPLDDIWDRYVNENVIFWIKHSWQLQQLSETECLEDRTTFKVNFFILIRLRHTSVEPGTRLEGQAFMSTVTEQAYMPLMEFPFSYMKIAWTMKQ